MEKIDKRQSKDYGPLVLWAGDLDELMSTLKDRTNLEFVADDMKFDSVEEFIKESKGRVPSIVRITADRPYLTVNLYPRSAELVVSSSQLPASGLFHNIDVVLSRCERKPKFFYRRHIWNTAVLLASATLLFCTLYSLPLWPYAYLNLSALVLIFCWYSRVVMMNHSIVHPIYREERLSFVRKNRREVVNLVIAALVGALITVASTKMADWVWPNSPKTTVEKNAP